ncbi:PREDICTED: uncharacterized protein At4g38062-like [Nicrophorus vespilloides]|uniref:Uncharacterized protein At4g38062-like n=1 Tax=Nicrophorus vespilloides TaxID=110193 RepID=A0ABM1N0M0_NICVS|nr:PREDICTED: uncharacterized protein At4g38062-like [Nicrophorus vespilloides]
MMMSETSTNIHSIWLDACDVELLNKKRMHIKLDAYKDRYFRNSTLLANKNKQLDKAREDLEDLTKKYNDLKFEAECEKRTNKMMYSKMKSYQEANLVMESKLKACIEAKAESAANYEDIYLENKSIKEMLLKLEHEKRELNQTVEDLSAKDIYHNLYKTDLIKQHEKTKQLLSSLQENMEKLNQEHASLENISERTKENFLKLHSIAFVEQKLQEVINEKIQIENRMMYYKGKCDQMEHLLDRSDFSPIEKKCEYFFREWKKGVESQKVQATMHRNMVKSLMDNLSKEQAINANLIIQQRNKDEIIESLERNVAELQLQQDMSVLYVKEETDAIYEKCGE